METTNDVVDKGYQVNRIYHQLHISSTIKDDAEAKDITGADRCTES